MRPQKNYEDDSSGSREEESHYKPGGFDEEQEKPSERGKKEKKNWYIKFASNPKIKGGEWTSEEYKKAIDFLGWDLTPNEIASATKKATAMALFPVIMALGYLLYSVFITRAIGFTLLLYTGLPLILVPILVMYYLNQYPLKAADRQRVKSITYIPEIVNYMVMSMKLTPNLEKAVNFAAEHGRGKIARDLQDITWGLKVGSYNSIEEALDELAYKWGEYSEEFKHGLMLIRSSKVEPNEVQRRRLLDKAMEDVLEGIKDDMTQYAKAMKQPSIYLYYIGVLLPLMLIIMLPIGSMMAGIPIAKWWVLILLYNIIVPIGTILFARNILKKRPPVYVPPKIPRSHPDAPEKGHMKIGDTTVPVWLLALAAAVIIYISFTFALEPTLNPKPNQSLSPEAAEAYIPFFQLSGGILAAVAALSIYLYGTSYGLRKVQKRIMKMEREFKDSIYILASRLGENKPMEEALTYTGDFLSQSEIGKLFNKTASNVRSLGMTVEQAFFDDTYGSLRNVPSDLIQGSVKVVVDSLKLGVKQASRTLTSLSMQLKDTEDVKKKVRTQLEDITAMMKSIAYIIGPLVLGITTALQKIIINALEAMGGTQMGGAAAGQAGGLGGIAGMFGSTEVLEAVPGPTFFLLIIGVYVVEVTIILIYFTSRIEEGSNNLPLKMNLAKSLPIALIFYFFAAFFASQMTTAMA